MKTLGFLSGFPVLDDTVGLPPGHFDRFGVLGGHGDPWVLASAGKSGGRDGNIIGHIYIYTYIHVYIYIYMYIYIHVYI